MRLGIGIDLVSLRRRVGAALPIASGGTETVINPEPGKFYRVHTFLSSGTLTVTAPGRVQAWIVPGGGSGGYQSSGQGGQGGGAGGVPKLIQFDVEPGEYDVVVGEGGAARTSNGNGNAGGNSSVFGTIAPGGQGGQGGRGSTADGGDGGNNSEFSGGLGSTSGARKGAGGGAGGSEDGQNGSGGNNVGSVNGGDGGAGVQSDFDGTMRGYSGGGGGSCGSFEPSRQGPASDGGSRGVGPESVSPIPGEWGGGSGGVTVGDGTGSAKGGDGVVMIKYEEAS